MEQEGTNSAASVQKESPRSCGELSQPYPSPGCRSPSPSVEQEGFGSHVLVIIQQGRRVDFHRKQKEEETAVVEESSELWVLAGGRGGRRKEFRFSQLVDLEGFLSYPKSPDSSWGRQQTLNKRGILHLPCVH